jgi:hypothetical protein
VGGEHTRKEPFEQLGNSNSEHLRMSARPLENARESTILFLYGTLCCGWHHVDTDPDPTFYFDADQDPDLNPTPFYIC